MSWHIIPDAFMLSSDERNPPRCQLCSPEMNAFKERDCSVLPSVAEVQKCDVEGLRRIEGRSAISNLEIWISEMLKGYVVQGSLSFNCTGHQTNGLNLAPILFVSPVVAF